MAKDHPPFTPDDYRALLADMAERAGWRAEQYRDAALIPDASQFRDENLDGFIRWAVLAGVLRAAVDAVPDGDDSNADTTAPTAA